MRPIPRSMMPDSLTVRRLDRAATRGGVYLDGYETMAPVRYEDASTLQLEQWQLQANVRGKVYIDARNTAGASALAEGDRVSIDGGATWRTVVGVAEYRAEAGTGVHHWEVSVS